MPKKDTDSPAESAAAKKPAAGKRVTKKPVGEKPPASKPAAEKPEAKTPAGKKPAAGKPTAKKAAARPAAGKQVAKKAPAKLAAAEQPAAETPAVERTPPEATPADQTTAENPLHKKLGLRAGAAGAVVAPPEDSDNPLLPLPDNFLVLAQTTDLDTAGGPFDYIHVFAREKGELASTAALLREKLAPGGSLWVSWIKQGSNRRGAGMFGDLNETIIRRIALMNGMVDVKVAVLDRDWSALKLVHRKR